MHKTALDHAAAFFNTYAPAFERPVIVEVGSADVNGSLRSVAPGDCRYIGIDFAPGKGVDIVLTDPYQYPLDTGFADIVVTSSCFEHAEFFWLSFLEILRMLKPEGVVYLNAPSNGAYHRYPTDCWRFYPDAGLALSRWAQRNGMPTLLMESFIGWQKDSDWWNDFVAVFLRDRAHLNRHPQRMHGLAKNPTNLIIDEADGPKDITELPQDIRRINTLIQLSEEADILPYKKSMLLFIRQAADNNKRIVIWGAGQGGVRTLESLKNYGVEIHAFLDSSPEKIGAFIGKLPVVSPEILTTDPLWNNSSCAVFVASMAHEQIARQLESAGWREGSDYFIAGMNADK